MSAKDDLIAEAKDKGIKVPEDTTKAEVQALPEAAEIKENSTTGDAEGITPPESTGVPVATDTADIATAIAEGFKQSKSDHFVLEADAGVEPRFSLVKNAQGEVLLRDNGDKSLSKIQLESIEEKEASIQNQEVTEL